MLLSKLTKSTQNTLYLTCTRYFRSLFLFSYQGDPPQCQHYHPRFSDKETEDMRRYWDMHR